MTEAMREQFEEAMRERWPDFNPERHPKKPDEYLKAPEHCAWQGYQAALRQAAPDIEQMLRDCVPGGSIVDPQLVCDNIREWWTRHE